MNKLAEDQLRHERDEAREQVRALAEALREALYALDNLRAVISWGYVRKKKLLPDALSMVMEHEDMAARSETQARAALAEIEKG